MGELAMHEVSCSWANWLCMGKVIHEASFHGVKSQSTLAWGEFSGNRLDRELNIFDSAPAKKSASFVTQAAVVPAEFLMATHKRPALVGSLNQSTE